MRNSDMLLIQKAGDGVWTPDSLASSMLSFDMVRQLGYSDTDKINSITDFSPSGHDATQNTGNFQPTYNVDGFSGKPSATFIDNNDLLETGIVADFPETMTIGMAVNTEGGPHKGCFSYGRFAAGTSYFDTRFSTDGLIYINIINSAGTSDVVIPGPTDSWVHDVDATCILVLRDGSFIDVYVDGVFKGTDNVKYNFNTMAGGKTWLIGDTPNAYLAGEFSKAFANSEVFDSGMIAQAHTYLIG